MKKLFLKAAVLTALLSILLSACGDIGGQTKPANGGGTQKDPDDAITGNITTKVTWDGKDTDGNPLTYYINSTIYIKDGGNLTITDGAIVKFGPRGVVYVNTTGAIEATGVKFTSYRDPEGRKISVAPDDTPAMGDWQQIDIKGGTGKFTSCKFYYGGKDECSTLVVT